MRKAKVWKRVMERDREKETGNYLVKSELCRWDFWGTTFANNNWYISLCSEDVTADGEDIGRKLAGMSVKYCAEMKLEG